MPIGRTFTIKPATQRRYTLMISSKRARTCVFFLLGTPSYHSLLLSFSFETETMTWTFDMDVVKNSCISPLNISNVGKCSSCAFPTNFESSSFRTLIT